jgi:hypothetical protein
MLNQLNIYSTVSRCFLAINSSCLICAALWGAALHAQEPTAGRDSESSRRAEAVRALRKLGADIRPFNESSDLLSVCVRTAHPEKNPKDRFGWTGGDQDLLQIQQVGNVACLNIGYKVQDQRSLRFLPELPKLKVLYDSKGVIGNDGMEYVGKCAALEKFSAMSLISDVGFRRLSNSGSLKAIGIASSNITDFGLENIDKLKRLESLSLPWSKLSDRGVQKIVALPALLHLDVTGKDITDRSVDAFASCKSLKHLRIVGTGISEKGAARLRELLPQCKVDIGHK